MQAERFEGVRARKQKEGSYSLPNWSNACASSAPCWSTPETFRRSPCQLFDRLRQGRLEFPCVAVQWDHRWSYYWSNQSKTDVHVQAVRERERIVRIRVATWCLHVRILLVPVWEPIQWIAVGVSRCSNWCITVQSCTSMVREGDQWGGRWCLPVILEDLETIDIEHTDDQRVLSRSIDLLIVLSR